MTSLICALHATTAQKVVEISRESEKSSRLLSGAVKAVGLICFEPHRMLTIGVSSLLWGRQKEFTYYSLNPNGITQEQSKWPPVLLLHGAMHNQGVWLSFAREAEKQGRKNLFYTVNLNGGDDVNGDIKIVEKKIREIQAQYGVHGKKDVKVHLVGYSRGAALAFVFAMQLLETERARSKICAKRADTGKIVLLGAPCSAASVFKEFVFPSYQKSVYEVIGTLDFLDVKRQSNVPIEQQYFVDATHLGLPYDSRIQKEIFEWIQQN